MDKINRSLLSLGGSPPSSVPIWPGFSIVGISFIVLLLTVVTEVRILFPESLKLFLSNTLLFNNNDNNNWIIIEILKFLFYKIFIF